MKTFKSIFIVILALSMALVSSWGISGGGYTPVIPAIPGSYLNSTDNTLTTDYMVPNQAMIRAYIAAHGGGGGGGVTLQGTTPGTADTGNLNISGTAIAGYFSGNGSLLTNLPPGLPSGGTVGQLVINTGSGTGSWQITAVAAGQPLLSGGVTTAPAYAGYTLSGTAGQTYTFPSTSKTLLATDGNAASSTYASGVTVANSTNASSYLGFFDAATGNITPKTNSAFTINASTGAHLVKSVIHSFYLFPDGALAASAPAAAP